MCQILDFSGEQQQEKPGSAASQGEKKQQQTDGKGVAGNEEKK